MNTELKLPDSPDALRDFTCDLLRHFHQLQSEKTTLLNEKARLVSEKNLLQEQINLLLHKRFSANSEKYRAEQSDLFNEVEAYAETLDEAGLQAEAIIEAAVAPVISEPTTEPTPARKPGRKALPAELPRVEIVHDMPEDKRCCREGHMLKEIGEEIFRATNTFRLK